MFNSKVSTYTAHHISLLDDQGETLMVIPLDSPVEIPHNNKTVGVKADVKVHVHIDYKTSGSR